MGAARAASPAPRACSTPGPGRTTIATSPNLVSSRVANFIEFIAEGKGTQALSTALGDAERRVETLRAELDLLISAASTMFQAPPLEWIRRRLGALDEVLARDTTRSALVLRDVLGPVTLRPVTVEVGRPYYQAETAVQVLNLLQDPDDGSNSLRQWRRGESNAACGDGQGEESSKFQLLA